MSYKMNKSWERERTEVHSPKGVEELRRNIRSGLIRFYTGIAESMWQYNFASPQFDLMRQMSRDTLPEKYLFNNGECVWFTDPATGTVHCLPFVTNAEGINMYGHPTSWSPVPIGWDPNKRGQNPAVDRIRDLRLDETNSVIMRNDIFGGNDKAYTESMVNELVDNILTMNQLQLIAKCPFVFNVTEDNMLTAKNYFLALSSDKPVIFVNAMGDKPIPTVESTQMKIDPALFEIFDRFECQLLSYYGFPCVPITKRAQQTVSEVQSNDSKLYARRQEKLRQRQMACERISSLLGASIEVVSVVDEQAQQALEDAEGTEHGDDDEDERSR